MSDWVCLVKDALQIGCIIREFFLLDTTLADPGGGGCCPNSSIFTYIFAKKYLPRSLVPPQQLGAPPKGNPGSATA